MCAESYRPEVGRVGCVLHCSMDWEDVAGGGGERGGEGNQVLIRAFPFLQLLKSWLALGALTLVTAGFGHRHCSVRVPSQPSVQERPPLPPCSPSRPAQCY